MIDSRIINALQGERDRQDKTWGTPQERQLEPSEWIVIATEELGEAAQASLNLYAGSLDGQDLSRFKKELIQLAAVAIAALEQYQ